MNTSYTTGCRRMGEYRTVCRVNDLVENIGRVVYVNDQAIAVFRVEGKFYAIEDTCPHMGASLAAGFVENGSVTCPWHFWRFRLEDGKWADNPRLGIGCYPVRVVGDEVQIEVTPAANEREG